MKSLVTVLGFVLTTIVYGQSNELLEGVWNGGTAFDGTGEDSLLLFRFDGNGGFHFNYGVNHDFAHPEYELVADTLILKRRDKFQDAYFLITKLTETELSFRVLNRPALHIANTMCSPYNHAEYPLLSKDAAINLDGITHLEALRLTMEFDRLVDEESK